MIAIEIEAGAMTGEIGIGITIIIVAVEEGEAEVESIDIDIGVEDLDQGHPGVIVLTQAEGTIERNKKDDVTNN